MRNIFFGPFRLAIKPHPHDPMQMLTKLFHNEKTQRLQRKQLDLLRFMADDHPGEELTIEDIAAALWPEETGGDSVEKQVSLLRKSLGDVAKNPQYIETLRDQRGYKFIAPVRSEGDLDRLDGSPRWKDETFHRFLDQTPEKAELRIVATGFQFNPSELPFDQLRKRGVNIKIIIMNPHNSALVEARHGLREDKTFDDCVYSLKEQVRALPRLAVPPEGHDPAGKLEWRLSDAMPCGFVVHSSHGALVGLYLAHWSYTKGPMIEVRPNSSLWKELYHDWESRWNAKPVIGPVQD